MRHEIEQVIEGAQAIKREISTWPTLAKSDEMAEAVKWLHTVTVLSLDVLYKELLKVDPQRRHLHYKLERLYKEAEAILAEQPRYGEYDA